MTEKWCGLDEIVLNGEGYAVSSAGRVWSSKSDKILKPFLTGSGYLFVCLSQKSRVKQYDIHRLVALAFIPNTDKNKTEVNHIDGDKMNNNVSNLEWVSSSENKKHAYKTGLRKPLPSTNTLKATLSICKPVVRLRIGSNEIEGVYESTSELVRRGSDTPRTSIKYQCDNKTIPKNREYYHRYASEMQVREAKQAGIYFGSLGER